MTFEEMCSATIGQVWDEVEKWRRLVEEAQGDAKSAIDALGDLNAGCVELETERDRLKGELTEARHDLGYYRRNFPGHCIPRPVAATPAEQAQGDGAKLPCGHAPHGASIVYCVDPTGLCTFAAFGPRRTLPKDANPEKPAPDNCLLDDVNARLDALTAEMRAELRDLRGALTKTACRIDGRVDALAASLDRITSPPSRPFVSEIKRHWDDPAVRDNFVDATLDDHEYRMRDLEARFTAPPEAAGPTCRKLIESLGALCTRRLDHGGGCEHDTREAVSPIPGGGAR